MATEPSPVLMPTEKKKSLWPTIFDYTVLILLALIVGLITVVNLTQEIQKSYTVPYSKLLEVTKPQK